MKDLSVNIIGRGDDNSGIAQHSKAFVDCLSATYTINFLNSRPEISNYTFDSENVNIFTEYNSSMSESKVSIFVDVTSDNFNDYSWQKAPATNLKYIYSVFDSTRIPQNWADIINNHFDAVFVPSHFLIDVYNKSMVHKPIFHLPLALNLTEFHNIIPSYSNSKPFTFSFIGANENRKNVKLLVDSFKETFGSRKDVRLRVHCASDFIGNISIYAKSLIDCENIELTWQRISSEDYVQLVEESDCFVSLSMGEGYSIVPRQFLAAGKPVVLADCLAHAEILAELHRMEEGLGFSIDASIPVPARYDHINGGGVYGVQYDVFKPSIGKVLKHVLESKNTIFDLRKIQLRKKYAAKYEKESLKKIYQSIIQPEFCRMSSGNELVFGGIYTTDANLASRITGRNCSLSGWQNVTEKPKKIVVIGNDGGFFSVLNRFISYLTWTLSEHPDSMVLPDWRIESMQKYWDISQFTSFCYGKPSDGNIWLKLFQELPYNNFDESKYNSDYYLYENAELKDDYNESNEPWLTYINAYNLYKSPGFNRWRHWYNLYFSAYVKLRSELQNKIDALYCSYLKGFQVISAHIRHPSHGIEQPGARMPTVDLYCEKIRYLQSLYGLTSSNSKIFLATDQHTVVERLKEEFGDMLVYSSDVARTTKQDDNKFHSLSKKEQMQEGFQIQHLTASDPNKWSIKMAEEVLLDTYLLAKGNYFVHVTSNIATAVSYINPRIEMHYCE